MPDQTVSEAQRIWSRVSDLLLADPSFGQREASIIQHSVHPVMAMDSIIVLSVPNNYTRNIIQDTLHQAVLRALNEVTGQDMTYAIRVMDPHSASDDTSHQAPAPASATNRPDIYRPAPQPAWNQPRSKRQPTLPDPANYISESTQKAAHEYRNLLPDPATLKHPDFSAVEDEMTPGVDQPVTLSHNELSPDLSADRIEPVSSPVSQLSSSEQAQVSAPAHSTPVTPVTPAIVGPQAAGQRIQTQQPQQAPLAQPAPQPQQTQQSQGATKPTATQATASQPSTNTSTSTAQPKAKHAPKIDPETQLNSEDSFENFVPGENSRFAYAAAFAVSESPGNSYNPLFIWGDSGLGKTHLLNAIGNYTLQLYPDMRVRYVNSEVFMNEFIESVKTGSGSHSTVNQFNDKYRNVDMLLIDDIQFLGGKIGTLEAFFHTFNALEQANKQIVIASDVMPKELKGFEERLTSRFEMGLQADLQPPNQETRVAILRMKLANSKTEKQISDNVLALIAQQFTDNIRELEGALTRVLAVATLNNQEVTMELAQQTLQDYFVQDVVVTPTDIITRTASFFGLKFDDLVSSRRSHRIALARQIAMYVCREMTGLSLTAIGSIFGGRDHTTVIHAYQKIANEMTQKMEVYQYVNDLTNQLKQKGKKTNDTEQ